MRTSAAVDLEHYLQSWSDGSADRLAVARTVTVMTEAARTISDLAARGALDGRLGAPTGKRGPTDEQKRLDLVAEAAIRDALRAAPVAAMLSEETDRPDVLNPGAPLAVAVDPIDGSTNIDAGTTIGTIFSVLPAAPPARAPGESFLVPGRRQRAAGFLIYGSFTALALTVGEGTHLFTLDRAVGRFRMTAASIAIPQETAEYAINASNYRHWDHAVQAYFDDCASGREGPRGKDFNMRWTASPVADLYRILDRGGVFLYPGDGRDGYANGRLRLIYEASPLAFVVEQAGGAAISDRGPILDLVPEALHQHTPIVAGSREEVAYLARRLCEAQPEGGRSPLFARRGLFR